MVEEGRALEEDLVDLLVVEGRKDEEGMALEGAGDKVD